MTEEELRLKLGLDTTELDSGTRRVLQNIGNFGQEAHKSFIHGDSAAKGFKKTIHELSEQMPLLGTALRLAISPIGGMFALAATSIAWAKGKLDDFNKSLDETGKLNAKPITGPAESNISKFFRHREEAKAGADLSTPEKVAASDRVASGKAHAQQLKASIQEQIAKLESAPPTDEREVEKANLANSWDLFMAGMTGKPAPKKPVSDILPGAGDADRLRQLKAQLAKVEDQILMLNHMGDTDLVAPKSSQGIWGLLGLGTSVGMTSRLAMGGSQWLKNLPNLDPATGDIGYKPLPGAPGYVPAPSGPVAVKTESVAMRDVMQAFLMMTRTGFPVVGKDQ